LKGWVATSLYAPQGKRLHPNVANVEMLPMPIFNANWELELATLETGNIGNTGGPPQFINNFSAGTMKSK